MSRARFELAYARIKSPPFSQLNYRPRIMVGACGIEPPCPAVVQRVRRSDAVSHLRDLIYSQARLPTTGNTPMEESEGVEPPRLSPAGFKPATSAIPPARQILVGCIGVEPTACKQARGYSPLRSPVPVTPQKIASSRSVHHHGNHSFRRG